MAKKICKEKECEACGAWFTPSRSNVKYCPNCRTHSDQIVRQMERNTQRNIDRYGYGQKNKKIQNVCKECGKIFISYLQPKDFCSKRCGDTYLVKHTSCAYCKKPMTMDDDVHDVKYGTWLCSDTCKEKWAWVIARKNGTVHTCPNCGKELNPGDKFCKGCGTKVEGNLAGAGTTEKGETNTFSENDFQTPEGSEERTTNIGKVNYLIRSFFFGLGDVAMISVILYSVCSMLKGTFGSSYYGTTNAFGFFFGFLEVIAGIAFFVSLGITIYTRVVGSGKENVDEAMQKSFAMLEKRVLHKLNVDMEQISEVEPIVIGGMGLSPDEISDGTATKHKLIAKFGKIFTKDPVEGYRLGIDGVPRYSLVQTTIYAFTDSQLLVYSGNMDIATGAVYKESADEIFYKDINSIAREEVMKKIKIGIFKKRYYTVKYVTFDVCGIQKRVSFDSRITPNAEASLTGMESYIREKKF